MTESTVSKPARSPRRRAFSMVEFLIALTITATLFTATLAALDTTFKSYKLTTESASTQIIARIVMQRVTAMIRTGEEFGPYPINPITDPVIESNWMQFVSGRDIATGEHWVTTLRAVAVAGDDGPFRLEYQIATFQNDVFVEQSDPVPLLDRLTQLNFVLSYDVGPKLRRATIDMVFAPENMADTAITVGLDNPHIRLVASAAPRRDD